MAFPERERGSEVKILDVEQRKDDKRAVEIQPFFNSMKAPEECENMLEIRTEIDTIDRSIIRLLGQRFEYVKAASKFKTSEMAVKAPERFKAMLLQRREWATKEGLNPEAIEKMYTDLVNHFIEEELKFWKNHSE